MSLKEQLEALGQNSITLNIADKESYKLGATRFGGLPDVPADFIWPTYEGEGYDRKIKERPLSFLAQLNCEDLSKFDSDHLLPDHGLLSFFYDAYSQPWGFSPKDKGCARVYWFEDTTSLTASQMPSDMEDECKFPMLKIQLGSQKTYPDWQDFVEMCHDDSSSEEFYQVWEKLTFAEESPQKSQDSFSFLLGWPFIIQNTMFEECDLVSQGFDLGNGYSHVPKDIRQKAEESARERWILLFQLGTVESDNFELMFGDCGRIYFYITKEDLAARRFDRIWLILQCY